MKAGSWILPIFGSIALAIAVQVAERYLQTSYLTEFLIGNLIAIIITVLAINAATLSITLGKVRDLIDRHGGDFNRTRRACMNSLVEQFALILIATIFLIAHSSPVITASWPWWRPILAAGFTACFFQELWVLFDTTRSVFMVLDHKEK